MFDGPPPSDWNPSGHAEVIESTSMGFFYLAGVESGTVLLRFDNGYCQRYHFIGSGVGLGYRDLGKGGAGDIALDGDAWNVYHPQDFCGGFINVAGYFIGGGSVSSGLGRRPSASDTLGLGIPGISGTYQGYWTTGPSYPCCSDGSAAPEDDVDCCDE